MSVVIVDEEGKNSIRKKKLHFLYTQEGLRMGYLQSVTFSPPEVT